MGPEMGFRFIGGVTDGDYTAGFIMALRQATGEYRTIRPVTDITDPQSGGVGAMDEDIRTDVRLVMIDREAIIGDGSWGRRLRAVDHPFLFPAADVRFSPGPHRHGAWRWVRERMPVPGQGIITVSGYLWRYLLSILVPTGRDGGKKNIAILLFDCRKRPSLSTVILRKNPVSLKKSLQFRYGIRNSPLQCPDNKRIIHVMHHGAWICFQSQAIFLEGVGYTQFNTGTFVRNPAVHNKKKYIRFFDLRNISPEYCIHRFGFFACMYQIRQFMPIFLWQECIKPQVNQMTIYVPIELQLPLRKQRSGNVYSFFHDRSPVSGLCSVLKSWIFVGTTNSRKTS